MNNFMLSMLSLAVLAFFYGLTPTAGLSLTAPIFSNTSSDVVPDAPPMPEPVNNASESPVASSTSEPLSTSSSSVSPSSSDSPSDEPQVSDEPVSDSTSYPEVPASSTSEPVGNETLSPPVVPCGTCGNVSEPLANESNLGPLGKPLPPLDPEVEAIFDKISAAVHKLSACVAEKVFLLGDKDNDGLLSQEEMRALAMEKLQPYIYKKLLANNMPDFNRDLLANLYSNEMVQTLQNMLLLHDSNQDGQLSHEELKLPSDGSGCSIELKAQLLLNDD